VISPEALWPVGSLVAIHEAALRLLERAGVRVDLPEARHLLSAAGCTPAADSRLLIPEAAVDDALASVPRSFVLAARDPERSLPVDPEADEVFAHNGGGFPNILDLASGRRRRATLADQLELARLMHHLDTLREVTVCLEVEDAPPALEPLYTFLAVALETDKYASAAGVADPVLARAQVAMAEALTSASGSDGRYPLDMAFSPVSPLHLDSRVTAAMLAAARTHRAVCCLMPAPTAGTTAPAALSAALAQQHAEVLAGVALVQAAAPGTPIVYGPRLAVMDPRTGRYVGGTPEGCLCSIAATMLARRCGLACDCYGPTTDTLTADAQFGWEHATNALLGLMARPRFLSGIGDLGAGVATCPEIAVLDDELLGNLFYLLEARSWDEDALDIEAMVDGVLSPNGFLGTKHTRRHLRRDLLPRKPEGTISFRGGGDERHTPERDSIVEAARRRADELLARPPVGLEDDILDELCRIIDRTAAGLGVGAHPDPRRLADARRVTADRPHTSTR